MVEQEHCPITEDGKEALMKLACGDLRRVLNLLQSAHASYPVINQDVIYMTAGAALPSVIEGLLQSLLNDPFEQAYGKVFQVCKICCIMLRYNCILYHILT